MIELILIDSYDIIKSHPFDFYKDHSKDLWFSLLNKKFMRGFDKSLDNCMIWIGLQKAFDKIVRRYTFRISTFQWNCSNSFC